MLPRRGGSQTHAGERQGRVGGGCLRRMRPPPSPSIPPPSQPHLHSYRLASKPGGQGPPAGNGAAARRGGGGAQRRQWGTAHTRQAGRERRTAPTPTPPRSRAVAHMVLGIHVGTLRDKVVEAAELAAASRHHEGRPASLRRRGGGATRGERRRCGGQQGRRVARAEGVGLGVVGAAGAERRTPRLWRSRWRPWR